MSQFLIDREITELLTARDRLLTLPDGTACWVKMFDLSWRWFDRLHESLVGARHEDLIREAVQTAQDTGAPLGQSLAEIVEQTVRRIESAGLSITETDADLRLLVAHRKMASRAQARKTGG